MRKLKFIYVCMFIYLFGFAIVACSSIQSSWGAKQNTNLCFFNAKGNPICQTPINGTMLCGTTETGQKVCVDMKPASTY